MTDVELVCAFIQESPAESNRWERRRLACIPPGTAGLPAGRLEGLSAGRMEGFSLQKNSPGTASSPLRLYASSPLASRLSAVKKYYSAFSAAIHIDT